MWRKFFARKGTQELTLSAAGSMHGPQQVIRWKRNPGRLEADYVRRNADRKGEMSCPSFRTF